MQKYVIEEDGTFTFNQNGRHFADFHVKYFLVTHLFGGGYYCIFDVRYILVYLKVHLKRYLTSSLRRTYHVRHIIGGLDRGLQYISIGPSPIENGAETAEIKAF